ncbi:Receptor-like serine/threonine-protein kinase SD1-8 [Zea mays]|uniref:non-specific serine/threonine protein kinase n=1 Tax=Zea mays TaxID=4577 RepID=A0A3L6G8Y0_MAIZE|nr:Receptor-like serine/threonine-protein kinase SD1-8 [Zea mays]
MAVLNLLALIIATLLLLFRRTSGAGISPDTLNSGGNVTDGETLVSAGGTFTLGFFSPSTTVLTKRYLGIWFTASGTDAVLWVANRETPLKTTPGVLVMSSRMGLRLLDGSGRTAWSSNTTGASASSVAQLLGSGNLVVREKSSSAVFQWQSFDHPQNTLLAGMRFGKNLKTGMEWSLTSWRAQDDPATGDYRRVMDTRGLPDIVTWHGNAKKYRAGPWNGRWFSGVPEMDSGYKLFSVQMVDGPDEVTYVLNTTAGIPFTRVVLDEVGKVRVLMWLPTSRVWKEYPWLPRDACDEYASCGAFGLCNVDAVPTPSCSCAVGFSPVNASEWSRREASGGCQRDVPLECAAGNGTAVTDRFAPVHGVKLPDTDNATVDMSATLEQCKARCLANCSCVAYGPADIRGGGDGSGCVMWKDNIVDVRYIENGQDLFLRLAKSESTTGKRVRLAKILVPVMAFVLALTAAGMYLAWNCKLRGQGVEEFRNEVVLIAKLQHRNLAWSLWIDDRAMDLVDSSLEKSSSCSEALRCIQIGLLCVQDNPNSRPLMSSVVTMLENESTPLAVPIQPMYFSYRGLGGTGEENNTSSSVNGMSLTTVLVGR